MVIDLFGLTEDDLRKRFPAVFQHLLTHVKPIRDGKVGNSRDMAEYARMWWLHGKPRQELRAALAGLPRYIATVETMKHRTFQFLDADTIPDNKLVVITSDNGFVRSGALFSGFTSIGLIAAGGLLERIDPSM